MTVVIDLLQTYYARLENLNSIYSQEWKWDTLVECFTEELDHSVLETPHFMAMGDILKDKYEYRIVSI